MLQLAKHRPVASLAPTSFPHSPGRLFTPLAQLGVALEGWALVYGHTHEPGLAVLEATAPHSQESRAILVGNSGSFRRKSIPPTWLEAQFPYLELWAYDPEKDDAVLVDRVGLPLECDATRDDCQAPRVVSPEIAATGA